MKLVFLPACQQWCFVLGDSIISLWDKSGRIGSLFQTRKEAVWAAGLCGLKVDRNGRVQ